MLRTLAHLGNDGEIIIGDAALAGVVAEHAWSDQQPMVQYLHAMHISEENLEPEHVGLSDHEGAWESLGATLTGSRRATLRLIEATAHKIFEGPLQGRGELVFEAELYSRYAADQWDLLRPINNRNLRDACAPMRRFAKGETRTLDLVLFDQLVYAEDRWIDAWIGVRELDWSDMRNYLVFESLLYPKRLVGEGWIELDLENPGTIALDTGDVDLLFELQVLELDVASPVLRDVQLLDESGDEVELWWRSGEPARASVLVRGDEGSRRVAACDQELRTTHSVMVDGLVPGVCYSLTPLAEDAARNLGRGEAMERCGKGVRQSM